MSAGLKHRTWQIAMDGSQKIPQRWLQTLAAQLEGDGNIDYLCLALAAWIRYVSAVDERGQPIDVQDPLADDLKALVEANRGDAAATVAAVLGVKAVFPEAIANSEKVQTTTADWLARISEQGVLAAVKAAL